MRGKNLQNIIESFIGAMRAAGCAPHDASDIVADGDDHTIRAEGDRKDKRLGYCLTSTPDGFAFGNFIFFKTGEKGSWHSGKGVKSLTKEERAANEEKYKRLEAERLKKVEVKQLQAASEAKLLWSNAPLATEHLYLTRKNILPHGAKIDGEDLIYQGVCHGKICTYQRISPDGTKMFLYGGKKKGTYYPMTSKDEPKETILITEGIATAATVREATGLPTLAAFDAGNLQYVAKEMRSKYPEAKIILCADNDSGGEKNTGVFAAQQAATKYSGFVVWPDFEDGSELTDWNDYASIHGLESVKEKILSVANKAIEVIEENDVPGWQPDDLVPFDAPVQSGNLSPVFEDKKITNTLLWKKWPSERDNGKLEPNNMHNILVFLRHNYKYSGLFRYNRFSGKVIIHKEPFWQGLIGEKFRVTEVGDNHIVYMEASMAKDGLAATDNKIHRAIYAVGKENWINPPLEYFNSLTWDKVPRLSTWLFRYLGASGDEEYLSAVGMAFLVAGVARIYNPGCKAENMLVLEGKQGLMKSTALSVLANIGRGDGEESYFCDTLGFDQINEKDTVLKTQGKLIIEIPDLAGLGSREIEAVKAWMSIQNDEIRVPYGKEMEKFPRQFILAGSTNESHWLKDQTGNRRFWPVKCGKIDINSLKDDREQLWSEAVQMYKNDAIWWIGRDSKAWAKAEIEQSERLQEDIWHQPIQRFVKCLNFVTVREILESFKIELKDQNQRQQRQVADILKKIGFVNKKKRINGEAVSGWERINDNVVEAEYEEVEIEL